MMKGINYWAFTPDSNGTPLDLTKAMDRAVEYGYDAIEPTIDGPGAPLHIDSSEAEVVRYGIYAKRIGLKIETVASGLAWSCSPTDPDPAVRKRAIANSEKMLHIAAWIGAQTILYLPGMVSASFVPDYQPQRYDRVEKLAHQAIEYLLPVAERLQVRIAIENVWNRFLLSPLEMRRFIESFSSEYVGAYFDVANCLPYGHPEHWIEMLGDRILAVHMKDFRTSVGTLAGFVELLQGDVDFGAVMRALAAIDYHGPCTIESIPPTPCTVEQGIIALRYIERLPTGLVAPPAGLEPTT